MINRSSKTPREERRKQPRRDEDLSSDEKTHAEFWAKQYVKHKATIVALVGLSTTVAGYLFAAWTIGPRVTKLEAQVSTLASKTDRLERSDELKLLMLCVLTSQSGASLFPRECGPIIEKRTKQ